MWKLFQLSIMAAVMCGNIYYQWTPNPYVVGLLGFGAAFVATWFLVGLSSLIRGRSPERPNYPPSHHKRTIGARWDPDNVAKSLARIRAGQDARKLIEIPPEAPTLEGIVRKAHPLAGTQPFRGKVLNPPGRH
jgi:hypothetical protein